jgi:hypothetical protein
VDTLLGHDDRLGARHPETTRLDMRAAANAVLKTRIGTVEDCAARVAGGIAATPAGHGRAGRRMEALCAVVAWMRDATNLAPVRAQPQFSEDLPAPIPRDRA